MKNITSSQLNKQSKYDIYIFFPIIHIRLFKAMNMNNLRHYSNRANLFYSDNCHWWYFDLMFELLSSLIEPHISIYYFGYT